MREILFRGKRIDNGEWVQGSYVETLRYNNLHWIWDGKEYVKIGPETIGQYTGLTDKNGKKIFEGDILQFDYIGESKGVNGKATVCFENGKFGVRWGWHKEFVCLDGFANTTLEVIGNIHDNSELLGA